jgi:hypothetical protein
MDPSELRFIGYGILIGLIAAVWVAFSAWRRNRALTEEVLRLRTHLQTHMEIAQEGSEQRKRDLDQLRKENENLRVTLKAWQQKPDRRELRMLQVYDRALRQLMASAPGFSPHWESALREAEEHVEQIDRGLFAFARRLILPFSGKPSDKDE